MGSSRRARRDQQKQREEKRERKGDKNKDKKTEYGVFVFRKRRIAGSMNWKKKY